MASSGRRKKPNRQKNENQRMDARTRVWSRTNKKERVYAHRQAPLNAIDCTRKIGR